MLKITSPYNLSLIKEIPLVGKEKVEKALSTAYALFENQINWIAPHERIAILGRVATIMQSRIEELTKTAAQEGGKPLTDSKVEVLRAINGVQMAAEHVGQLKGEQIPMGLTKASENRLAFTTREPIGVVSSISAFNHPLNLIIHQVITAVAAGCPVIVKPALTTPLSCLLLVDILKDEDGYVNKLVLEKRGKVTSDLFIDCSGFHRLIMKTMAVDWEPITQQPTQSAWVAPIKYNDPHKEMKPYTQSYAVKSGWNFIITLYSRMGSGYVFDSGSEDPDKAREDFIKYWDGYEFIRDPRLIQWEQGCYKSLWEKNVIGIGMAQGFIDPMEANIIFMAQTSLQLIDAALRKYKQRVVPHITKKSFSREIHRVRDQIDDFIAFHFGLSKRRDTPFWKKWGEYGLQYNQPIRNWDEYKRSNNFLGRSFFIDTQYADQQMYLNQEVNLSGLDIDPKLLPLAKIDYEYRQKKNKEIAKLAPNVYDWSRQYLHEGATSSEILEQALSER